MPLALGLRYASAAALADDLQRYLDGESISARSVNVLDRLVHALDRTQHAVAFAAWGPMLVWMGVVVGVEHLIVFLLIQGEAPRPILTAARFLQFVLLALLFWANRRSRLLPTTSGASKTAARCPNSRLSSTTTSRPCRLSSATVWEPM